MWELCRLLFVLAREYTQAEVLALHLQLLKGEVQERFTQNKVQSRSLYRHLFCKSTVINRQHTGSAQLKLNFCDMSKDFLTITRDHAGWSLTGNRTKKNMSTFLAKKVVAAA